MFYVVGENNYRRCYLIGSVVPADMVMAKNPSKHGENKFAAGAAEGTNSWLRHEFHQFSWLEDLGIFY